MVLIALCAVYLAAWEATNRFGRRTVESRGMGQSSIPVTSPAPLLLRSVEYDETAGSPFRIRYHIWLFGLTYTIPIEGEYTDPMIFKGPYSPSELQEKQRETGGMVHFDQ
jgi:hypothetical protein